MSASMKKIFSAFLLLVLVSLPHPALSSHPQDAGDALEPATIRAEFDNLFGEVQIYQTIQKHLPDAYEDFFQSYLAARRSGRTDLGVAGFVSAIRNTYLKQSCDESVLDFFRYTSEIGRNLFAKDPEAAFAYMFGGDPSTYEKHLDLALEQQKMGAMFERMLASRAVENSQQLDRAEVDAGLDYVYVLLYYKHGKNFSLLTRSAGTMDSAERRQLLAIHLDMYEEIFNLVPTTRSNVLRSMAMKM
jgi:hypothetical protein